jgi:peptidyl-prolyl cis-trans isomerase SurA
MAEFERQYLRTLPDSEAALDDSLAEYQDFLGRYVDFRLKVMEAEDAGYASRGDLLGEMEQYRGQLARPYLLERAVVEPLIQDLYDKKQELVDVSHILIRVDPDAPPVDTLRAYNTIVGLVDSVRAGADFGELAARHSEDPSARDAQRPGYQGRLGFYSGGRMVKPFEDRMFSTPTDSLSEIFRTQFGFHVLKVHGRRPMQADRRLAHIMIQPAGQTPADSADAFARLDTVVARLEKGEDFADLARDYSNDQQTAGRGGDLDFVAFDGWLPPNMRDEAFRLDSLGAISAPIQTAFGQHLVKFLAEREMPSFEESYEDLKNEIARLPRSKAAEDEFASGIRRREGAHVDSAWVAELLGTGSADSVLFAFSSNALDEALQERPIAFLADSAYSARQFGRFAAGYQGASQLAPQPRFHATLEAFLNDRAIGFEVSALEARDPEFRETMQQFRDGLMLFRLMEDSVWTAASSDSSALAAHYEEQAASYQYPDRYRILGIASSTDSLMVVIHDLLEAGAPYQAIVEAYATDSTTAVRFDTTFVEGETASIYDQAIALEEGGVTGVLSYAAGRIVLINDGVEAARPKTFEEARAEVVTAYQAEVEERLLSRLREEHHVRVFPERLTRAFESLRN